MNGRRRFLAFLGGASVTGLATTRASATAPTLILPPGFPPTTGATALADAYPLLAGCQSEMHAFLKVKQLVPSIAYMDWLEGGLRIARLYNGRTEAELDALLRAGVPMSSIRGDWA